MVDGISAASGAHSYDWDTSGVEAGDYYVTGYMYDGAGTFSVSPCIGPITIESAQSFVLTGPTSGTYTAGDTVTIQWTAGGVLPGSTISLCYDEDTTWHNGNEYWIVVDGISAANGAGSYDWNTTDVEAGNYHLTGYMYDGAGTFTVSPPIGPITIQSAQSFVLTGPTSGTYTAGDTVTIQWTASGVIPGSTLSLCYDEDTAWVNGNEHWFVIDGISAANGTSSYDWDTTGVAPGDYHLAGYMYDGAGTFTISPAIGPITIEGGQSFVLTGPTSGTYTAGDTVTIQWTAAGVVPGSTISLCHDEDTTWVNGNEHWFVIDGISAANGTSSYDWDTTDVAAGDYYLTGYMYDGAGAFTISPHIGTITIEAGQSFALTGPTSGSYTAGDTVTIEWTASGVVPGSTISLCYDEDTTWFNGNEEWIVIDGISAANGAGSYDWDTTGVQPGDYYLYGYMYDGAGTFTIPSAIGPITIVSSPGVSAWEFARDEAEASDVIVPPTAPIDGPGRDSIVDNRDSTLQKSFKRLSGSWSLSRGVGGYYGQDYAYTPAKLADETARARFSCTALSAGRYDVYTCWSATSNRATRVAYEIHHANGVTTVRVDQTKNGGQWNLLGTYDFAGGSHIVEIHNGQSTPGKFVCADAVKFARAGAKVP